MIYLSKQDIQAIRDYPTTHDVEWPTSLNKQLALAFTKFETFDQCPRKYRDVYLLQKIPYVETPELKWGNKVHKHLEGYVLHGTGFPKDVERFKHVADQIIATTERLYEEGRLKVDVFGEQQWAMTLQGKYTSWTGKDVWVRGKADVGWGTATVLRLLDYKTGKGKYPKPEQLDLLALLAVAQPNLSQYDKINSALLFLETGMPVKRSNDFTGTGYQDTLVEWQERSIEIIEHIQRDYFPEKQTPLCAWCDVMDCPFNTKAEREAKAR